MFNNGESSGYDSHVLEAVEVANVEDLRAVRRQFALTLTIRHADIPSGIQFGTVYLEGSLRRILETLDAAFPRFFRDMEAGVSDEGGAALSPSGLWDSLAGEELAFSRVVRSGGKQR